MKVLDFRGLDTDHKFNPLITTVLHKGAKTRLFVMHTSQIKAESVRGGRTEPGSFSESPAKCGTDPVFFSTSEIYRCSDQNSLLTDAYTQVQEVHDPTLKLGRGLLPLH